MGVKMVWEEVIFVSRQIQEITPQGLVVSGVVLADQVKSLDWRARQAERAGRVTADVLQQVLKRVGTLIRV